MFNYDFTYHTWGAISLQKIFFQFGVTYSKVALAHSELAADLKVHGKFILSSILAW